MRRYWITDYEITCDYEINLHASSSLIVIQNYNLGKGIKNGVGTKIEKYLFETILKRSLDIHGDVKFKTSIHHGSHLLKTCVVGRTETNRTMLQ